MRPELEEIALIENYLHKKLSKEQMQLVETRMKADVDFKKSIEFQRNLQTALRNEAMAVALNNAHNNWINGKTGLLHWLRSNLNSLLLIIGSGVVISLVLFTAIYTELNEKKPFLINEKEVVNQNEPTVTTLLTAKLDEEEPVATHKPEYNFNPIDNESLTLNDSVIENRITHIPEPIALTSPIVKSKKFNKRPADYFYIDPTKGGVINDTLTGIKMIISPTAFLNKSNGEVVKDSVKVKFTAYRTKGELVLSKIPMNWYGLDSIPFTLHSEGMFSVFAYQGNDELVLNYKLNAPVRIDYSNLHYTDSLAVFYLENRRKPWKYIQNVSRPILAPVKKTKAETDSINKLLENPFSGESTNRWSVPDYKPDGIYRYGFWGRLFEFVKFKSVYGDSSNAFKRGLTEKKFVDISNFKTQSKKAKAINSIVPKDAPLELIINKLGFYGLHKLQRNQIAVKPFVFPTFNGLEILNIERIVAVESESMAAYHFYSSQLCLKQGKAYSLFVFTEDKRIYYLNSEEFKNLNLKQSEINIEMIDVSESINSSTDIDEILNKISS